MNTVEWWAFSELTGEPVAGPFASYEDADDYCDGFDDVYAAWGVEE